MAKLVTITEIQFNSESHTAHKSAIPPKNILNMTDVDAGCQITLRRLDASNNDQVVASESVSALATGINAANTSDIHKINIPVIIDEETGEVESQDVFVDDIHIVKQDTDNNSRIWIETPTKTGFNIVHASRTVAQIVTAANS